MVVEGGSPKGLPTLCSDSRRLGGRVVRALQVRAEHPILPFHRRFIRAAFAPGVQVAALSCPRGSAKTWIAAQLAALALVPGSPLWETRVEVLAVSASLQQSRILLQFVREALAGVEAEYRWLDSGQRLACTHKATGTKLRILSSSGKRAMGLAQFSMILADEPGSWETRGGALMFDALRQSLGKRDGQRLLLIGTRAPAEPGGWWPALLDSGSGPGTHVTCLTAPRSAPWDAYPTIRKVNPLIHVHAPLRRTILRERDDARRNPAMRPAFEAYRLNREVAVYSDPLVTVEAWEAVEGREVPPRVGRPVVGVDLGSERSWSAAWCLWPSGRSECFALCPGIPDLSERERADAMPRGLYLRLHRAGVLLVDEGLRVSRPSVLIDHLLNAGIRPAAVYCDRFMLGQLRDAVRGRWPIVARQTRWSEATEDISAFRQLVADGPLSIVEKCRALAVVSLSQAAVHSDDQGSVRLRKRAHGRSRDDVAVAAVLAAGAVVRLARRPPARAGRVAIPAAVAARL